ncbi:MAG: hypothetical protein ACREQA_15365 [Candidatus Binatia bacterium]
MTLEEVLEYYESRVRADEEELNKTSPNMKNRAYFDSGYVPQ